MPPSERAVWARVLFHADFLPEIAYGRNFDVSADRHFAVIEASQTSYSELHVFLDFFDELERLAPQPD